MADLRPIGTKFIIQYPDPLSSNILKGSAMEYEVVRHVPVMDEYGGTVVREEVKALRVIE